MSFNTFLSVVPCFPYAQHHSGQLAAGAHTERILRRVRLVHRHQPDMVHQDAHAAGQQCPHDGGRMRPAHLRVAGRARLLQGHHGQLRRHLRDGDPLRHLRGSEEETGTYRAAGSP